MLLAVHYDRTHQVLFIPRALLVPISTPILEGINNQSINPDTVRVIWFIHDFELLLIFCISRQQLAKKSLAALVFNLFFFRQSRLERVA